MTTQIPRRSSRIARRAVNQGARSAAVMDSPAQPEKSVRDPKTNLLKCKNTIIISTFNVRTLSTINQIPELIANSINLKVDVICIQEHRIFHDANERNHPVDATKEDSESKLEVNNSR